MGVTKTQTPKTQTSDPENSDPLKSKLFSILFTYDSCLIEATVISLKHKPI